MKRSFKWLSLLMAMALLAAACGGSDSDTIEAADDAPAADNSASEEAAEPEPEPEAEPEPEPEPEPEEEAKKKPWKKKPWKKKRKSPWHRAAALPST